MKTKPRDATPPCSPDQTESFDLRKVNVIRGRLRRGAYHVDADEVAERLLFDHLLLGPLLDGDASAGE